MSECKDDGVVSFVERDGKWLPWEGTVVDGLITATPIEVPREPALATAAEVASLRADIAALKTMVEALKAAFDAAPKLTVGPPKTCPTCGSDNVKPRDYILTSLPAQQDWDCHVCGSAWRERA